MARVINRLMSLNIGVSGTPADVDNEVSSFTINSNKSDSDFLTFAESRAGEGPKTYTAVLTLTQDHVAGSLWDLVWSHVGETASGVWAPYGNDLPSPEKPHYEFTATIAEPEGVFLGGDANSSTTATATVEVTWSLDARPTKVIA